MLKINEVCLELHVSVKFLLESLWHYYGNSNFSCSIMIWVVNLGKWCDRWGYTQGMDFNIMHLKWGFSIHDLSCNFISLNLMTHAVFWVLKLSIKVQPDFNLYFYLKINVTSNFSPLKWTDPFSKPDGTILCSQVTRMHSTDHGCFCQLSSLL